MLKTIDPLLDADVPYALRAMGHGDRLVIRNTSVPAGSVARQTAFGELPRIDNVGAARATQAVLPLDAFDDDAAVRMEIVGQPNEVTAVQRNVHSAVDRAEGKSWPKSWSKSWPKSWPKSWSKSWPKAGAERHAFYEQAKAAYCVIASERRFYGRFLFTKGVVPPEGAH